MFRCRGLFAGRPVVPRTLVDCVGVTKRFERATVLDGVDLQLTEADRIMLVGPNGAGKSVLARILAGLDPPTEGTVTFAEGLRSLYLPQDVGKSFAQSSARTIQDYLDLMGADGEAVARMRSLGLAAPLDRNLTQLSGGEKTKVALSCILRVNPDLMILDEPSNNLDARSVQWLVDYLLNEWKKAFVLVTHDRHFLHNLPTKMVEVDPGAQRVRTFTGDYFFYLKRKLEKFEKDARRYERQQKELKQLRQRLAKLQEEANRALSAAGQQKLGKEQRQRAKEGFQHQKAQEIGAVKRRIEEIERDLAPPEAVPRLALTFSNQVAKGAGRKPLLTVSQLSIERDGRPLLRDASFTVGSGERVVIVGENGVGKTTLLHVIAQQLAVTDTAGRVQLSPVANVGVMFQEHDDQQVDPETTVGEYFAELVPELERQHALKRLQHIAVLSPALMDEPLGALSVGQRRRLHLAAMIMQKKNLILLDEPTNHLDLLSKEVLENALLEFEGAVLAVSHDRWFANKVGMTHLQFKDQQLQPL